MIDDAALGVAPSLKLSCLGNYANGYIHVARIGPVSYRYPPLQSPAVPANKTNLSFPPLQSPAAAQANKTNLVSPLLQSPAAVAPANKTNMSTYTCGFCNIEYTLLTGLTRHMTSVHAIPSM